MVKDIDALIERVKAATGPDREIDECLALIAGWRKIVATMPDINGSTVLVDLWFPDDTDEASISEWVAQVKAEVAANLWRDYDDYPRFTASIDAALALTERVLPGWEWLKKSPKVISVYRPLTEQEDAAKVWAKHYDGTGATIPLAILAATLSALINRGAPAMTHPQDTTSEVVARLLAKKVHASYGVDRVDILVEPSALEVEAAALISSLVAERDEARQIVRDTHWMAVRYADGRQSYAVGMCNDAMRKAYDAGWLTYSEYRQHDLDPQYARDGSKPEYRHVETRATTAETQLVALTKRVGELEGALTKAARHFDAIRGAVESNQVVDKDVHGTAIAARDAARRLTGGERQP